MRTTRLITAAAAASLLWGCSLAPHYERPQLPTPDRWEEPAPAAAATTTAADIPWRDHFADPRLRSLIGLALANNRDLRVAGLAVERARAAYRIQRADLYPDLAAGAGGERARVPADLSPTGQARTASQYSVDLGFAAWELDFFGRIRSLKDAALEQYLATESAHDAAQISLVSAVAAGALTLAADRDSLALARATVASRRETLDLTRDLADAGFATELDLQRAASQVESARADAARLESVVALDRHALSELVGAPVPDELLPDSLDAVARSLEPAPELPSEALLRRPDVLAAEHQLRAANADIGAARAAFFPRITLTASGGTASSQLSGLFEAGSGAWSFAPRLTVPIFTGGAVRAGLEVAKVDRDIAVARYEQAIQAAFREVADALSRRATLADELDARRALVTSLDRSRQLTQLRSESGLDGSLEVLIAEQSLYAARQSLLAVELADRLNLVELYRALGGGADREGSGAGRATTSPTAS